MVIKLGSKKKTPLERVLESIESYKLFMNAPKIELSKGIETVWLNPNCQDAFNSGWYVIDDFIDFVNNTGRIIKGKTQDEKEKYVEYANFIKTVHRGWSVASNYEFFSLVKPNDYARRSIRDSYISSPLTVNKNQSSSVQKYIRDIFGSCITSLLDDLCNYGHGVTEEQFERIENEYRSFSYGLSTSLYLQGVGNFGASNTPTRIENLSWYRDVVFSYAYYQSLLKLGINMPDFDFVRNNRYKS